MRPRLGLLVLSAISVWSGFASAQSHIEPGDYQRNASFIRRRFLTDSRNVATLTDDLLYKTDKLYKVPLLFPNGGLLDSNGVLDQMRNSIMYDGKF